MDKLTWFEQKYQQNLKGRSCQDAFYATIEQVGFDAYSTYASFATVRRVKNRKKKRHQLSID